MQILLHLTWGDPRSIQYIFGEIDIELRKPQRWRITQTSVPVLAAEDETGIIGQIVYNQATDELLGFCGVKGLSTSCY